MLSFAYMKLLILLLAIKIPSSASSSPAFLMMYSAYKLNKQGDNIQPWRTPLPIWNQPVVPCPVLTVASWPAYKFLKRQVRWPGIPISFRIFHSFLWSTQLDFTNWVGLKVHSDFVRCYGKTWKNFLANPVVPGFYTFAALLNFCNVSLLYQYVFCI